MHVVLGMLGSLVTILWLLHRLAEMGIDLGGLNPWLWQRRRKWKKQYQANPIFSIDTPLEATALLVAATAKADGDMSSDEKREILSMFETEFHLSQRDAAGLLISSTHLLGDGETLKSSLKKVLEPSIGKFTSAQSESTRQLVGRVANIGGAATEMQMDLVGQINALLEPCSESAGTWSDSK